jgi:membrane-bound lytic murein transglycosylase D
VAIIYAINYAEEHNMMETAFEQVIPHDTVMINQFLHFDTFAKLTNSCTEELLQLNPSIRHSAIPESARNFVFKVPIGTKAELEKNRKLILDSASKTGRKEIESIAKNAKGNIAGRELLVYRVKSGDVLGSIALRHRVRLDDLRKWNNLRSNMIRPGQRLNIWVVPSQKVARTTKLQSSSTAARSTQ